MANAYSDGTFANALLTSNSVSYPFPWPNNSTVAQFDLEYVQAAANYSAASLGSTSSDAPSGYLVEQGPVVTIAPGYIRFKRTYCQLPQNWQETRQIAYTFPGLSGPAIPNANTFNPYYFRAPITLYKNATVYHNFSQGSSSPSLDAIFQVTDGNNVVDYIGPQNPNIGAGNTNPSTEPSTYTVSSDSQQIRALIWEKVTITVPKPI